MNGQKLDENRQPRCSRPVCSGTKIPSVLAQKGCEGLSCIIGNTTPSCNQNIEIWFRVTIEVNHIRANTSEEGDISLPQAMHQVARNGLTGST